MFVIIIVSPYAPPPPCPCPCPQRPCIPRWRTAPSSPQSPPAPAAGSRAGRAWTSPGSWFRGRFKRRAMRYANPGRWSALAVSWAQTGGGSADDAVVALYPHSSDQRSCLGPAEMGQATTLGVGKIISPSSPLLLLPRRASCVGRRCQHIHHSH